MTKIYESTSIKDLVPVQEDFFAVNCQLLALSGAEMSTDLNVKVWESEVNPRSSKLILVGLDKLLKS